MRCFVVSEDLPLAAQLRAVLLQLGHDCPAGNVVGLDAGAVARFSSETAYRQGASADDFDVLLVTLSPNAERSLAVLTELRRAAKTKIFVVGPTTDAKIALRALRSGADEFLDQSEVGSEFAAALERIHATAAVRPTSQTIAVVASGGGCGSSTVAVNLAAALAQKVGGCGLLDLRLKPGDLAALLDLKSTYTIADLCQNIARLDTSLLEGALVRHQCGVQLLAAPERPADVAYMTGDGAALIVTLAARIFPFVVLDVDHGFDPIRDAALTRADVILLVLRLDFTSLRHARRILEYFEAVGIAKHRIRAVANHYGRPGELSASQAQEALGIKVNWYIPDDPKTVNRAGNHGRPYILEAPSAKASRAVAEIAATLQKEAASR